MARGIKDDDHETRLEIAKQLATVIAKKSTSTIFLDIKQTDKDLYDQLRQPQGKWHGVAMLVGPGHHCRTVITDSTNDKPGPYLRISEHLAMMALLNPRMTKRQDVKDCLLSIFREGVRIIEFRREGYDIHIKMTGWLQMKYRSPARELHNYLDDFHRDA